MFNKRFRDAKQKLRKEMMEQGIEVKGVKIGDLVHESGDGRFPAQDIWCDDPGIVQTEIGQKTPHYITEDDI